MFAVWTTLLTAAAVLVCALLGHTHRALTAPSSTTNTGTRRPASTRVAAGRSVDTAPTCSNPRHTCSTPSPTSPPGRRHTDTRRGFPMTSADTAGENTRHETS